MRHQDDASWWKRQRGLIVVRDSDAASEPGSDEQAELPEGTSLRVYLFLLQQSRPVGLSEVRDGVGLSTSSLASYHLDRLTATGFAKRADGGYLADKMALKGFFRVRMHIFSTSLFMVGFFAATLLLLFLAPWHSRGQQIAMGAFANVVALVYSLLRTFQSTRWLQSRIRSKE